MASFVQLTLFTVNKTINFYKQKIKYDMCNCALYTWTYTKEMYHMYYTYKYIYVHDIQM